MPLREFNTDRRLLVYNFGSTRLNKRCLGEAMISSGAPLSGVVGLTHRSFPGRARNTTRSRVATKEVSAPVWRVTGVYQIIAVGE